MGLHILMCPGYAFFTSGKCQSACDKNFIASVTQELAYRIS